jgi:hypothetical protein
MKGVTRFGPRAHRLDVTKGPGQILNAVTFTQPQRPGGGSDKDELYVGAV